MTMALKLVHTLTEKFQYHLIKASERQKRRVVVKYFEETKYTNIFPIDTYKKDLDEVVAQTNYEDWEWLRIMSKNME